MSEWNLCYAMSREKYLKKLLEKPFEKLHEESLKFFLRDFQINARENPQIKAISENIQEIISEQVYLKKIQVSKEHEEISKRK